MAAQAWTPHSSLTTAPTNLKEAIDWVLRVTGRDGKKNEKNNNGPHCLCYLAKAVKDLLYDAKDPGTPGPSLKRYWDGILLEQEQSIVKPVLTDLGLVSTESTSATSTTCAGGTEVIKTLIDQFAQGLQKWVGWQEGEKCCLKGLGDNGNKESKGIGNKCDCNDSGGTKCCTDGGSSHDCTKCGKSGAKDKCYLSAYQGVYRGYVDNQLYVSNHCSWTNVSNDSTKVHLLARIFLGSVCLIWSGLSQLGFLTKEGSGGDKRWSQDGTLKDETKGLGSFMAAMGYDLERLNQDSSGGQKKDGTFVQELLTHKEGDKNSIKWKEFTKDSADKRSVAEYYSTIYSAAQSAANGSKTEEICTKYPLLVLHILASGYFRAGSAGANKIPVTAKEATPKKADSETTKKDTPSSRKPRTIREILYWLSALPYSQGYKDLVGRMQHKYPKKKDKPDDFEEQIVLHGENSGKTTLLQKDITHYLMAACGYCPLVLIGIQGTIATSGNDSAPAASGPGSAGAGADQKKQCPEHSKDRNHRCNPKEIDKAAATAPQSQSTTGKLEKGQVCYGGYHLEVSKFGPLHGMYANGLFGFDMDISPAQCLDQLRVYVYHCFYQLYFLRKQCTVGVEKGTALGWQSCRYGKDVKLSSSPWSCSVGTPGTSGAGQVCQCKSIANATSPLMSFLCDELKNMHCPTTYGSTNNERNPYPNVEDHFEAKEIISPGHFGKPPMHCPVPMGWQILSSSKSSGENHFKDLNNGTHKTDTLTTDPQVGSASAGTYPAHCTGNTLSHLLEYYCDPGQCHGTLVVLLRLLACITPTVPRTLGDLFGFYYYIVYIGGKQGGKDGVYGKLKGFESEVVLYMGNQSDIYSVVGSLKLWNGSSSTSGGGGGRCSHSTKDGSLRTLCGCGTSTCGPYLSPLSGQQYAQLSPLMAGTYLSWLVYLIEGFETGLSQPW